MRWLAEAKSAQTRVVVLQGSGSRPTKPNKIDHKIAEEMYIFFFIT